MGKFLFCFLIGLLPLIGCGVSRDMSTDQELSEDSLLTLVQERTFQYFWEGAEPVSGMARERIHMDGIYPQDDENVVTAGGSGFGLMAIIVGIERGFITREEGIDRFVHIVDYLGRADRFHGTWPHWLHGETGKVKPFSPRDDGADLVETAFLVQGLLTVKAYLNNSEKEQKLADDIERLWRAVEWNWFERPLNSLGSESKKGKVLYWHWSPNVGWEMNHPVRGYDECLITYVLAASSPTHAISPETYHEGWARGGGIKNDPDHEQYGYHLPLRHNGAVQFGGPLFWAHYSYLGLDPRNLKDQYADYWQANVSHTMINRQYCIENPNNFKGYGANSWGLTASYSINGYAGHSPTRDYGVISPTAALSSMPYAPAESIEALRYFYYQLGDRLWGKYGFYDAFSETEDWFPQRYLAIDQGPIPVMIENYRTGLLWDLFMQNEDVRKGLDRLGFRY
jgi:hypothetical protein